MKVPKLVVTETDANGQTAALNVLPDLSSPTSQTEKMTGTDGRTMGENASCQNPVFPVSPPVSLECVVQSSSTESCGVDKQMSASAKSPGKTDEKAPFQGLMGAVGFEQSSKTSEKACIPVTGGAESGALGNAARTANAELFEIATTWPTLPPEVRNMILGVIRCTFRTDQ